VEARAGGLHPLEGGDKIRAAIQQGERSGWVGGLGLAKGFWPFAGSFRRGHRPEGPRRLARSLFYSTAEGALAAASENFAINYVPLFAVAAGASALHVSLLTAIPNLLANALQIPFGRMAERKGRNKPLWLLGNSVVRWVWLPMALLPWLIHDRQQLILALLLLTGLRGIGMAVAIPAWTALMADLTHRSWRGSYFGLRNLLANGVALAASVVAGFLIEAMGYPEGYALAFGAAWLVGLASLVAILPIHEPRHRSAGASAGRPRTGAVPEGTAPTPEQPARRTRFGSDWLVGGPAQWRREAPGFYEYAVSAFLWTAAVNLPAALFAVHFTEVLHGTPELWGIANGATFLTTILGQRQWGRLCDRVGQRPVMIWSGIGAALLPLWWAVIPSPAWVVAINLVGGIAWAGYNLAAFNLVLEVTPDSRRPSYVAVFNLGVGIAASAAPILGGLMAEWMGTGPVMAISSLLRLGALALFAHWSGMRWRRVAWGRRRPRGMSVPMGQDATSRQVRGQPRP